MPVFEYKCVKCETKFEVFHKSTVNQEEVACPKCSSKESKKLFSTFSASVNSSHSHGESCASGNCGAPFQGGCPGGMCGLN
jgi:putative FmdB family regulatory protein